MILLQKVLCLGASIMHGQISSSFIDVLKKRPGNESFQFINRAVPGFEAYNVLVNLGKYIECKPDYVVILVGTNDVTSELSPSLGEISRKLKKIPHPPSIQFYKENLLKIIKILKEKTAAKIAIASLPMLGEDLNSDANKSILEYNLAIKEIAYSMQICYIPVYERLEEFLKKNQTKPGRSFEAGIKLSLKLMIKHFLLRKSFDEISEGNGFLLLTDGIHLNSNASAIISGEIESFLQKE